MPIVGGYSLDLYCDNQSDVYDRYNDDHIFGEFVGYDRATVFREAKEAGWKIDLKTHKATCPKCNHKTYDKMNNNLESKLNEIRRQLN